MLARPSQVFPLPFYVTLKSGKKKNFSDIWEYSNWVLQGHQIPISDADGRGERCSYWKESNVDKSEIDYNGTYRDMCLAADEDVHNSKIFSKDVFLYKFKLVIISSIEDMPVEINTFFITFSCLIIS